MYQLREEKKEMKQFSLLLKTPEGWKAMNHKLSGAFIWEKRKKKTFKKKSIKQKKITLFCEEFGTEQGYV